MSSTKKRALEPLEKEVNKRVSKKRKLNKNVVKTNFNVKQKQEEQIQEECPICYQDPMKTSLKTKCGHTFCNLCITRLLKDKPNCPMCRKHCNISELTNCTENSNKNKDEQQIENGTVGLIFIDYWTTHRYQRCCRYSTKCPVLGANDSYEFMREPNNPYDSNAIAIYGSDTSQQVGYIPRYKASILAPLLDQNKIILTECNGPCCTRSCQIFASITKLIDGDISSLQNIIYDETQEL